MKVRDSTITYNGDPKISAFFSQTVSPNQALQHVDEVERSVQQKGPANGTNLFTTKFRDSSFTDTFNNIMYRDTSLFAASRQGALAEQALAYHTKKTVTQIERLEENLRKQQILQVFRDTFSVQIADSNAKTYSESELFIRLRRKHFLQIELKAVVIIQKFFRMSIKKKWWTSIRDTRNGAASKIQKNYRSYRRWNIIPKIMRIRKENAALVCQKLLQGYRIWKGWYMSIH
eukprot:CAMPEP_0170509988 /NCGR_PEP_ID=MMETSP0208-20121228/65516_1 /TAXON_ID=197538 /ORGANISM="Strombidium inclinatum, Strain S3" /LENGTH=230 /DNA_ID=CAMNT_0010793401 /DNA_START=2213 /DNA_END=2905 /DNA_ORIENTATION=-